MIISSHGHAQFLLETQSGLRILTDPFNPDVPWPYFETSADVVTSSHGHFDHCHFDKVQGSPVIVKDLGAHAPAPGVRVTGYPSFHDDAQGAKRGPNIIYLIEVDSLKVAHLGDLGAEPAQEVLDALRGLDVVFVPVGGTYTLDAGQAAALMRKLQPRVVIPMHFKKASQGFQNIEAVDAFLTAMQPLTASHQPLLRVTAQDISEAPPLVVLDISDR